MKTLIASLTLVLAFALLPASLRAVPPEAQPLDGLNIPDVALVDQNGKPVHFYTDLVKGKVVAMNFVFTSCTTICPPMGANFAKLQKLTAGKGVHLISVSVDPGVDNPERLKAWAGKFGAGPGWTLVTGDRNEVIRLLKALGVYTAAITEHSPLVLLGNDAGHRWTRAYGLAAPAKLAELIEQISPAAVAKKETRP
ncbi:MAG TPA: SCO family protein [Thermoanaerobaculia bacterium]|nr:SCO family protein [Thermoanaerobaculia bacterium]